MKYNYEKGGKVQISGKWYEILGVHPYDKHQPVCISLKHGARWVWEDIIQGYEAPTPPPFEWLPPHYNIDRSRNNLDRRASINAWLTETYGDPTVHTYNGEPAEQFGLTPSSPVLRWINNESWLGCWYKHLHHGQRWRKQPPAPKEVL
jgi:hypothetical protein